MYRTNATNHTDVVTVQISAVYYYSRKKMLKHLKKTVMFHITD